MNILKFSARWTPVAVAVVASLTFGIISTYAQNKASHYEVSPAPKFDSSGQLVCPKNFREWVFLGAPVTPNALNNGVASFPEFHNVYTQPEAFKKYRATGKWPEGTMMVKELQLCEAGDRPDGSIMAPSGRGYFPDKANGIDCSVKDSSKFSKSKNWGYFTYGHHAPPYAASAAASPIGQCAGCHIAHADEDMVYVKMYKAILDPLPPGVASAPAAPAMAPAAPAVPPAAPAMAPAAPAVPPAAPAMAPAAPATAPAAPAVAPAAPAVAPAAPAVAPAAPAVAPAAPAK